METIGDAYVCASGMPSSSGHAHSASTMILLAVDFARSIVEYKARCKLPDDSVGLRIGVHSGDCVGGVIGTAMLRYHLFGRTMHIVEVLESTAPTYSVHISEVTKAHLDSETGDAQSACNAVMSDMSLSERCASSDLVTSKGVSLSPETIDGLKTFFLALPNTVPNQAVEKHLEPRRARASFADIANKHGHTTCSETGSKSILDQLDLAVSWHAALQLASLDNEADACSARWPMRVEKCPSASGCHELTKKRSGNPCHGKYPGRHTIG